MQAGGAYSESTERRRPLMSRFDPSSHPTFQQLENVRNALLRLHKVLLDGERIRYEKDHGSITTPQMFLQLAIHDPAFNWLHRLSELVVQIDEATEDKQSTITTQKAAALLAEAKLLLTPQAGDEESFGHHYYEAIQSNGGVATMHAELHQLLEG